MKFLVLDVETTFDGHVFNPNHKLYMVGCYDGTTISTYDIDYPSNPYGGEIQAIQRRIDDADILIGFNFKFDLHWLRRYGINFQHKPIWDLQYAEYTISGQTWRMPSLDVACTNRGIEGKSSYIYDNFWSKGIDTDLIPRHELREYLSQDLRCTWNLFQLQRDYLQERPKLKQLIWDGSQDLLVTEEMEWNGLKYNHEKSLELGNELLVDVAETDRALAEISGLDYINWSSTQHVSAVLYGGVVKYEVKEPYLFVYKDGRTKPKVRTVSVETTLPRMVAPLKNSETATDGYWSTDEGNLKQLRCSGVTKELINKILERKKIKKRVDTYFHGIPKKAKEMEWAGNIIHGQLNHCVAATARLASAKPNLQNLDPEACRCLETRF